ncbi:SLBB domain-containing protein [Cyclobacterium jeungdonense]|uniref:SLBB domain-containing protein n=1 Tax=Cyclobacterium jeungdonense TaxID=708087 RepID=A0ABT8C461_9BACT|nr:SLBB domain-containing protein [Cyclobacterium jeungdonense]MDN3686536.1 SLBB domain-containing protein [Cyclobacterium jeungdonense]
MILNRFGERPVVLLVTLYFTVVGLSWGQSLQDIQNIKVDELSDAQIEQLIRRAEDSGMDAMQLEAMARERGMPAMEVNKLRQRIQSLRSGIGNSQTAKGGNRQRLRNAPGMGPDSNIFDSLQRSDPYYDLSPKQKKIFGFTLFHNRELDFSPNLNLPTPPQYVLGPGDQLLIDIYGASQQSYDLTISPEGSVFVPNVGPINVGGSTVEAARTRVQNALEKIYQDLASPSPNTFLQLRVGDIRSIQVTMAGELRKPGSYTLPSFASVFNALFIAGGPNENGTFREIQVYRGSKLVGEVDVYDYLISGDQESNIILQDNDVVIVPPLRNRVELVGPVRRPGFFEIKGQESIEDLLRFAGGFTSEAYQSMMTVKRTTDTQMMVDNIYEEDFGAFGIKDGDTFIIGEILNRYENRVQISGAVFRPGEFALQEGMKLKDLVEKAEGLRGDAFTKRAILYRTNPDFTMEILSVDLAGVLDGSSQDILLKREDILNVPSIYDLKEEYYVQISGEVNRTGVFQYGANMTVADLVIKANGFKESATNSYIEIARRVKDDPSGKIAEIITLTVNPDLTLNEEEQKIILSPFDHVFVRKSPGFQEEKIVEVEGEVLYPGGFALEKRDERISDVLERAGGLNQFAYPKGATLIRRTEYFDEVGEEERILENLESLRGNLDRDQAIENAEAEKQLMNRLEERVTMLKLERLKKEGQTLDNETFSEDRYSLLEGTDSSVMEIALREQELIGIEMEKILQQPGSKYDLILQEGDIISIPKQLQTVKMRGEVLYPTTARYDASRGFKNYISRAGGFSEEARKGRSYVIYANGDVKRTNKFLFFNFFPKIEPGAEIIVPKKPERQPLSVQAWIGMATSLATLAILMDRLSQ